MFAGAYQALIGYNRATRRADAACDHRLSFTTTLTIDLTIRGTEQNMSPLAGSEGIQEDIVDFLRSKFRIPRGETDVVIPL